MDETSALSAFSALSSPTRLRILKALVAAGAEGVIAGDIAKMIGSTPSRASFHLNGLADAGLIVRERQSRQISYKVDFNQLGALVGYLLHDCCQDNEIVRGCCKTEGCC